MKSGYQKDFFFFFFTEAWLMIFLDKVEFPLLPICLPRVRASHFTLSYSQYSTYLVDFWADGIHQGTQGTFALEFLRSSGWDRVKVPSLGLCLLPLKLNLPHSWFPLACSDTRSLYLSCAAGAPPPHSDNTTVPCHRPSLNWPCTASAGNHCVFQTRGTEEERKVRVMEGEHYGKEPVSGERW